MQSNFLVLESSSPIRKILKYLCQKFFVFSSSRSRHALDVQEYKLVTVKGNKYLIAIDLKDGDIYISILQLIQMLLDSELIIVV
jgi:hypothetical protein